MSSSTRSYAKAFYESATEKNGGQIDFSQYLVQLRIFEEMLAQNSKLKLVFSSPQFTLVEKKKVIEAICSKMSFSSLVVRFLTVLVQNSRLDELKSVIAAIEGLKVSASGGVVGKIISADAIQAAEVSSLEQLFSKKLSKPVHFQQSIDPTVLAGIKVEIAGTTYDATLFGKLERLKEKFIYRQ